MNKTKGIVVSTKMNKTIKVKVERMIAHPKYNKLMKREKDFLVHCDKEVKVGDVVEIMPCKKISKRKYFKIV